MSRTLVLLTIFLSALGVFATPLHAQDWFSMQSVNFVNTSNQAISMMNEEILRKEIASESVPNLGRPILRPTPKERLARAVINGGPFFTTSKVYRDLHLSVEKEAGSSGQSGSPSNLARFVYNLDALARTENNVRRAGLNPNNLLDIHAYYLVKVWKFGANDSTVTSVPTYRAVGQQVLKVLESRGGLKTVNNGMKQTIAEQLFFRSLMIDYSVQRLGNSKSTMEWARANLVKDTKAVGFNIDGSILTPNGFVLAKAK